MKEGFPNPRKAGLVANQTLFYDFNIFSATWIMKLPLEEMDHSLKVCNAWSSKAAMHQLLQLQFMIAGKWRGAGVLGGKGAAHTGKLGRRNRKKCISMFRMSLSLFPACASFHLANPGPSLHPCLEEPCFLHFSLCCLSLLSTGTWLPLFQRDFPCSMDKHPSLSEKALCPGGSSILQLGDRQLRGRFKGHL